MTLSFGGATSYVSAIDVCKVFPFSAFGSFTVVLWMKDCCGKPAQGCLVSLHDPASPSLEASIGIFMHTTVDPRSSPKQRKLAPYVTSFVLTDSCERSLAMQVNCDLCDGLWHKLEWRVTEAAENHARVFVDDKPQEAQVVCAESPREFNGTADPDLLPGVLDGILSHRRRPGDVSVGGHLD